VDCLSDKGMVMGLFGAQGLGPEQSGGCVSYVPSLRVGSGDV
jgi:hypothetical protein